MKYYFSYIFLVTILFSCLTVNAQVNSAYTRIGIGDIDYNYSALRLGMGQVGVSIADRNFINTTNPAGLFRLSLTRFETGIKYNGQSVTTNTESKFYAKADFNGFTFGFPVSTLYGIGTAVGIIPYSSVNYNIVDNEKTSPAGNYTASYQGKGGLSRMFLAASYKLPFNLNMGASLDYYFGTINYINSINFSDQNNFNGNYNLEYSLSGLGTTFGLISPDLSAFFNSETITDFRIGAALSLISKLTADTTLIGTSSFAVDTISSAQTKMKIPYRINAGASFTLNSTYLFSLDYLFQPWSDYTFNSLKTKNLRNASKISAGFEYKPVKSFEKTFWEQISLRAGLSFEQTQYIINGEGIDKFSVSGGFSIPISPVNSIDIGLELSEKGTKKSNLFKENIYKLYVGINLGELWFVRQENN